MTHWSNPLTEYSEAVTLVNFVHIVAGLYIWEFVLNLNYEFSIIAGNCKFSKTLPLYVGCRWFTLAALIIQLVAIDMSSQVNCKVLVLTAFLFAYLSFLFAAGLIILRIYALWERSRTVLLLSCALWFANTVAFIYNAAISSGRRIDGFCDVDHLVDIRVTIISSFITDLVLLYLMLSGILRWKEGRQKGGIWRVLYKQGLFWVLVVTLADLPPVIFILLNLNAVMDRMFLVPGMVAMSIGALRLYRGLVDSPALSLTIPSGGVGAKGPSTMTEVRIGNSPLSNSQEGGAHLA